MLERASRELQGFSEAWTGGRGPVQEDLEAALPGVAAAYARSGGLFRAFAEGAAQVPRLRVAWRGVLDDFIAGTAQRIQRAVQAGDAEVTDSRATASALVLMTEAYLRRLLEDGELDPDRVTRVLAPIWAAAITQPK